MWADAIPNLLIGLREGLEAGLVVSILLAALRQANDAASTSGRRRISSSAVWLGVLGAVMVAAGFATVLTYATNVLSSSVQEAVGGLLSVLAVGLVTGMVLWMRRTARTLTAQLRGEVARAVAVGAGALTVTAFLAVGREGLETTLFIWTAAKASGSTVAPVIGAGVGLAAAVVLCWLLYERAIRLDLGKFFNRTAIALIVIAAGVLSYGLGDLQDAGWLSGQRWVAFDLTGRVDPNSWWVSIISGVTDLAPRMTVLQVVAWVGYLAIVIPVFVRTDLDPVIAPTAAGDDARGPSRWERLAARRPWPVAGVLVVVPVAVAMLVIVALPSSSASATTTAVTVTKDGCGREWASGHTGTQTFEVDNKSAEAGEINLDNSSGGVVAEIETIGPATSADLSATLGPGQYSFVCLMSGGTIHGNPVQVSGTQRSTTTAVKPVTLDDLTGPNKQYQAYAARELVTLAGDVHKLRTDLAAGNVPAADADWLAAQLDWERVGASYDSFGDEGTAVDGLPDGLPAGVNDPGFTGLHRIEYGLYHGQSPASLVPVTDRLAVDVTTVQQRLTTDDEAGDPTNLTLRVHEILEDALRDHLSGVDDEGSGMAYPETYADVEATRTVLGEVSGLIDTRLPTLVPTTTKQLDTLQTALLATRADGRWRAGQRGTARGSPARGRRDRRSAGVVVDRTGPARGPAEPLTHPWPDHGHRRETDRRGP